MSDNPLYTKLLKLLNANVYGQETQGFDIQLAWGEAEDILKLIWPTIETTLIATRLEGFQAGCAQGAEWADPKPPDQRPTAPNPSRHA